MVRIDKRAKKKKPRFAQKKDTQAVCNGSLIRYRTETKQGSKNRNANRGRSGMRGWTGQVSLGGGGKKVRTVIFKRKKGERRPYARQETNVLPPSPSENGLLNN